ncbi:MAG: Thiol-driven fumarate reductase, flavoprotein subunit [Candidatus Roizmanbacteria bacterium GW2011_GWA2_34_18]|uniref:Thiol-driven fumarate reductase, flavoprotein subunit n=1 Tax=Candidatus Roizmanbacteria bacterium GW2011_GWA2_34_18 TaxID=1618477 RepID=A0A0G0DB10_9BACT|nr:MAG: Thiol-driven fumarate reductase, flavoprotein subunit [Candidatus Roizmanbacteria bacterium GW2011_GWA2_34_18]
MNSPLSSSVKYIKTDILVIGAGGAGIRAAIEAKKSGLEVFLLGKEVLGCAHTGMAMGGMNAAMVKPATPGFHAQITIEGGYFINNYKMVKVFTDEMPARVHDLESYGVIYDRLDNGEFYTWAGPKQKYPLNVCVGDYTGREMMQGLVDEARKLKIKYTDEFFVSKLLTVKGQVVGAIGINIRNTETVVFQAKSVILASGGAGRMYKVTTNAMSNTGDGYAMALDAGAELIDMEMVQFHPTGMANTPSSLGVLVTEKTRAHGGILRNKKGERFMSKYYPKEMELAKRDEVSRSIYLEVAAGLGTKNGAVYLHVDHWPKTKILEIIPDVYEQYKNTGVDISKEPMEIYPSMHHMMGGVKINEWSETIVPGLYATGEVAGGVHGANRLGGNSIAEGQVFGRRAGIAATKFSKKIKYSQLPKKEIEKERSRIFSFINRKSGVIPHVVEDKLKQIMWDKVGIFRDEKRLVEAKKAIAKLKLEAKKMKTRTTLKERNRDLQDCLEIENMLVTAESVIDAAILRKESRGAHSRTDYPKTLDEWRKNIVVKNKNGKIVTEVISVIE